MLDLTKNIDEELLSKFLQSPDEKKEWQIWKCEEESPLDYETYRTLIQGFPKIPEKRVSMISLFERNDTSVVSRNKMNISLIILPALELRFRDPDNPDNYYIGFVEGRENLNKFLLGLLKNIMKNNHLEEAL